MQIKAWMTDIVVIGSGPAGVLAALSSSDLGARIVLVASSEFGSMAAKDGSLPVEVLAHAAWLFRAARQLGN
jgi:pyruvate/2-oxoglutarate dehydrogenase complex dihydrolipoamide dehydrogenase (E3) component